MIIPTASDCQSVVRSYSATHHVLTTNLTSAIVTAVASGATSCTQSVSGNSAADIQTLLGELKRLGYAPTLAGTTLTVSWR